MKRRCKGDAKGGARPKTFGYHKRSQSRETWGSNQKTGIRSWKTYSTNQYVGKEEDQNTDDDCFLEYSMYKMNMGIEEPY